MDRFIVHPVCNGFRSILSLKSNMDRFIARQSSMLRCTQTPLKSNMDRFIVDVVLNADSELNFKIQYG